MSSMKALRRASIGKTSLQQEAKIPGKEEERQNDDLDQGVAAGEYEPSELPQRVIPSLARLLAAMPEEGVDKIQLEISGSGDSGQIDEYTFELDGLVVAEPERPDFRNWCHDIYWGICEESSHSGWYNNDGGNGTMNIYADGRIEWDHNDYFTESNHSGYQYRLRTANG